MVHEVSAKRGLSCTKEKLMTMLCVNVLAIFRQAGLKKLKAGWNGACINNNKARPQHRELRSIEVDTYAYFKKMFLPTFLFADSNMHSYDFVCNLNWSSSFRTLASTTMKQDFRGPVKIDESLPRSPGDPLKTQTSLRTLSGNNSLSKRASDWSRPRISTFFIGDSSFVFMESKDSRQAAPILFSDSISDIQKGNISILLLTELNLN